MEVENTLFVAENGLPRECNLRQKKETSKTSSTVFRTSHGRGTPLFREDFMVFAEPMPSTSMLISISDSFVLESPLLSASEGCTKREQLFFRWRKKGQRNTFSEKSDSPEDAGLKNWFICWRLIVKSQWSPI